MSVMATINDSAGDEENKMGEWKQIKKEITCLICRELFTDPKTIPCLHTFCKQCIEGLQTADSFTNDTYCPECRCTVSCQLSSVPTNSMINRLVDIFKQSESGELNCNNCTEKDSRATCWCVECNSLLCVKCNNAHARLRNLKSHRTVAVSELMQSPYGFLSTEEREACKRHSKQLLDLYCKTCNIIICRDCTYKDHPRKVCDVDFIDEVVVKEKEKIKHRTDSLERLLNQMRNKVKEIEKYEKQVDTINEANIRKIQGTYDEVSKLLNQQKEKALQKVEIIWASLKMTLSMQKEIIKLLESQTVTCHNFSKNVAYADGMSQSLTYSSWIANMADNLTKKVELVTNDPVHDVDVMITCAEPAEVVASFCTVTQDVPPSCTICSLMVQSNGIKLTVTLKDVCGSPVVNQSNNLNIRCNNESEYLKEVKVEEQSDGLYHIWYCLKRMEKHLMSLYCAGLVVKQEEVIVPVTVRDYTSINKELMIIDKYGPTSEPLQFPYLFAKGPDDEIFVNDDATNQVVIFDHQLKFSHVIGRDGGGNEGLQEITGIVVDKKGCLYVADNKLNCIKKFTLDGQYISQFGSQGISKGQFQTPSGLLLSMSELLFVCDRYNDRIQVFKKEQFSYFIGKYGKKPGCFHEPVDLTMNTNEDKLFITDHKNHRIQVFTPDGQFLEIFGVIPDTIEFTYPTGICFTPDVEQVAAQNVKQEGHVLVCSYGTDRVLIFKEDGSFASSIEGTYQGKQRFTHPCGVIMKNNGQIVVAGNGGTCGNRLVIF